MEKGKKLVQAQVPCEAPCDILPVSGPILYFIWRPDPADWQILDASSNLKDHIGYSLEDFLEGRASLRTITHPDDLAALDAEVLRHIRARETGWSQEYRFITRDGRTRWYRDWNQVQYDPDGTPRLAQTVALDITESREASDSLRASERRYRLLHQSLSDAYVKVDMEGRLVEFNQAYLDMLGRTAEEARALTYSDLTPARWHEMEAAIVHDQVLQRDHSDLYEKEYVRKDGTVFPIELRTYLLRDEQGRPEGMWAIIRDISRRKAAEAALRESERKYRLIVETAQEGVWIVDAADVTVFANDSMAAMLGCTVADMTGKTIFDFTDESGRRLAERNLQRRREGIGEQHEFRFVRKDGSDLWTLIETSPLRDEQGRYQGALAMVMDISARRAAEEARRALEVRVQRVEKSESLGLMAGGIAHDFNNILASIGGNLDLALGSVEESVPVRRNLLAAQASVHRAAALCRHMLAYSGGGISDRRLTSVAQILQDQDLAGAANLSSVVRLSLHVPEGLPSIDADIAQIRQALINIVTNAGEAIGDAAGEIRLSASVQRFARSELVTPWQDDNLPEGEYVCLEVADNGSGISADTLPKIFDPFFSTRFTGRGLGLPSALGIVRSHRGVIRVESRVGKGTTVRVLLPAARSGTPAAARDTQSGQVGAGFGKVLVVDDEPAVREVAGQMLRRAGYVPLSCACGRSALETFGRERAGIRCVLLDVTMPGMSGEDTLRELRKLDPKLPVVVMSGYSRNDVATRFAGLAGWDFLEKPFSIRALHDTMGRALPSASGP